jgi:hypothetical protein
VVGALFHFAAFLIQFLALPFPAFALSFAISGIGNVFQVNIYIYPKRIATDNISFDLFVLVCIFEWLHRDSTKGL